MYKVEIKFKMSLSTELNGKFENHLELFLQNISTTYNINKDDLNNLWKTLITTKENISETELLKYNKNQLSVLCKKHGYNYSGNKSQLINRLLQKEPIVKKNTINTTSKKNTIKTTKPVLANIISQKSSIIIKRNNYNNYEHSDTGFVFDNTTNIVIGKQILDKVLDLTKDDILKCKQYNFSYKIPFNLDQHSKQKIELKDSELDDEDEEEDDILDEIVDNDDQFDDNSINDDNYDDD